MGSSSIRQSKYGIFNAQSSTGVNGDKTYQIWNNPNGYDNWKYIYTGYAGEKADEGVGSTITIAPTNVYEYNTSNGTKASTTGTVYGIYDMAGGSWEYVAGCIEGKEEDSFGVTLGESKYVDLYTNSRGDNLNYEESKIGDAIKETVTWNNDNASYIKELENIFNRGRML